MLKIVSFNMEFSSENDDRIVAYLKDVKPDVVLLQEIPVHRIAILFERLKQDFPSQAACPPKSGCILGLMARAPMLSSGYRARSEADAPQVWAEFSRLQGAPVRVISTHIGFPLLPFRQARHIESLARDSAERKQPLIVGGDFNLTPWSWLLNKLAWQGRLRRHGTLTASWPADWRFGIGPFMLLDNIVASEEVKGVSFDVGPDLGSDHRPIVSVVSLP